MGRKAAKTYEGDEFRYGRYMKAIRAACDELGLVAYLPDYHSDNDPNTVLIYYKEDAQYNLELERAYAPFNPRQEEYKRYLFSIQNTDVNGRYDPRFANFGTIDLRGFDEDVRLGGAIRFAFHKAEQLDYIMGSGGILAVRESDDVYNGLNRLLIADLNDKYGQVYLGSINFYGDDRKAVAAGEKDAMERWDGGLVYNFSCSFAVPKNDEELTKMIRAWNDDKSSAHPVLVEEITSRVEHIGGINLIWY